MRLTLRTMLAYMDDVLDPADAEALRHKIEESDFASGLVDRIQGVLKKLRMDAPRLDGKGMGNDANTVAEYLDSALTQDRVAEFERVCLESDKHLSEVASCHQILTIVLGKAADVPPDLRQRIYALGDPAQAAMHSPHSPPAPTHHHAAAAVADHPIEPPSHARTNGKPHPPQLEVPEYLRSGRESSLWPFTLVAAIALVLTLAVLWQKGLLSRLTHGEQPLAAATNGEEPATQPSEATSSNSATVAEAGPNSTDATPPNSAVAATTSQNDAVPAVPVPASLDSTTESPDRAPVQVADASARPSVAPTVTPIPEPTDVAPATPPQPATPVSPEPPKVRTPVVATPARPKLTEVGRYTSDNQLIATLDRDDGLWYAKQPQEILMAGEQLVVLPPYRPQISLPSAVQLTFAGEGALKMEEPDENKVPRLAIDYGRFLAATAGKPGAQVELNLAGIKGVVTLVDGDSVLAIKVARWVAPGTDPEAAEGQVVVELYNTNGRVTWQRADQANVDIPARHVHVYQGDDAPQMYGPFISPEWIDYKVAVKSIDREAAASLEKTISYERPLNLSLQEVMKDRKVRPLAARCLVVLGEYDAVLRELADPNQYSFWQSEFEAMRQALSRSPETAARVRERISLMRAADAKDIYRLLWGFSEEQLAAGAAGQLVKFLEHDQLDIRVLAHANLISITGPLGYYRPASAPAQMKPAVQNWRDRKDKGGITYKVAPSPHEDYRPITTAPAAAK